MQCNPRKSQGQTIDRLKVDLAGIFEFGQTYVALSRASKSSRLQVTNFSPSCIKASNSCMNFHRDLRDDVDSSVVEELIDVADAYAAQAAHRTTTLPTSSLTSLWDKTNPSHAGVGLEDQDESMKELEDGMVNLKTN
ncbi:TPA_asm: hypothetical protein GF876_14715 [Listeria monocytogenes]|nr:hypothetical protein [Listeria monocytogenes]HAA5947455.1 hypothetical protein [Listeria monocytogenes]HAA5971277.1 hypothetical protein [Listeria monocytogenes]